jgi:hypothetical protein
MEGGMGLRSVRSAPIEGCGDSKEFAFCERFTLASPQDTIVERKIAVIMQRDLKVL